MRSKIHLAAVIAGAVALGGCATVRQSGPTPARPMASRGAPSAAAGVQETDPIYWVLVAEMASQRNDPALAVRAYLRAAHLSNDAKVARRAVGVALAAGDDGDALQAARRWQQLAPDRDEPRRVVAVLYLRTGQTAKARAAIAAAIEGDSGGVANGFLDMRPLLLSEVNDEPVVLQIIDGLRHQHSGLPEAQYTYASLALAAGKPGQALAAVRQALKLAPGWPEARVLYARVLLQRGATGKALDIMLDTVRKHPDDQSLHVSYGQMLLQAGRTQQARNVFEHMLKRHPHSSDALYALGVIALQQGRYRQSHDYLMRSLRVPGHREDALYQLGQLARQQGHYHQALQWFLQVQGGDHVYAAQIEIAQTLADMGQMQAARDHLAQLRKQNPDLAVQLYLVEGELLRTHGQYQAAYRLYGKALDEHSHNLDLLYARALVADHLDKIEQAEQDLRAILERKPEDAAALNALGYTLADRTDRYQEAYKYISKAYRLDPDNPAVIDSMGWVYFRMGDYAKAEKYLRRAHELTRDPEVAAHFGQLLWVTGRRQQARKVWEEAHKAFPDNRPLKRTMERFLQ